MSSTRAEMEATTALVVAALVRFDQRPSEDDIAALTGQLLQHGALLVAEVADVPGSAAALADWELLTTSGAENSPLGTWTYARGLARTVRRMTELLNAAAQ
ncbi:DUF6415 family natural product biosynthesis protein [Streptomyces sp. NBC_01233]|uniref:DUF6415 family natural product biosynthesis protein n=1 Tax=Streptomyces sp. NBC_01233 TaxID=2903787 RepID=UPI002E151919|nr:DUF6415 family natural product biosynthesis protein [Streptomyces sp. NBC_01233]